MADLRSVSEHQQEILHSLRPLPPYEQPLLDALGLVAAADVYSPIALPTFDNSAMDGYAVAYDDVASASDEHPVHLPWIEPCALESAPYFLEDHGRARIDQRDGSVPGLKGCHADDLSPAEVVGIDNINPHHVPLYPLPKMRSERKDVSPGWAPLISERIIPFAKNAFRKKGCLPGVGPAHFGTHFWQPVYSRTRRTSTPGAARDFALIPGGEIRYR